MNFLKTIKTNLSLQNKYLTEFTKHVIMNYINRKGEIKMKSIIFAVVYGFTAGFVCSFLFENQMWLVPSIMGGLFVIIDVFVIRK